MKKARSASPELIHQQQSLDLANKGAFNADAIPSGLGVFDFSGEKISLRYVNAGYDQMIGAERHERKRYAASNVMTAVFPEDRAGVLRELRASMQEKRQFRHQFRLMMGNGSYRWVEVLANHAPVDGETERFYASYYDIDKMLQIQQKLTERDLFFEDILRHSNILHFAYYPDQHRYVTEIMPYRVRMIPKTMDDYPESFMKLVRLSEADQQAYRAMVAAIDAGAPEAECVVFMNSELQSGWYRIHLSNVPQSNGGQRKAVGNVYNVDRFKELEQAVGEERLRIESLQSEYLVTACFNVTRDMVIEVHKSEPVASTGHWSPGLFNEAIALEPGMATQSQETLAVLLSAAEQIPSAAQRARLIQTCSCDGLLRLFRQGKREATLEYQRRKGGKLVWVCTHLVLLFEPGTGDMLAFFYTKDIDEEKQSRQIIRLTVEESYDFIALIHPQRKTASLWRISPEDTAFAGAWIQQPETNYEQGMRYSISNFVVAEDQDKLTKQTALPTLLSKLETQELYALSYDRHLPDGQIQRKQLNYRWLDDSRTEILATQTDVTVAYEREQARTGELRQALQLAEQASSAKSQFVSRISHDIRTPLGIISNMVGFAREDMHDPEKLTQDLNRIDAAKNFLLSLINDVLDISKIDSGKVELNPVPYSFAEHRANIQNLLEAMCSQNGLNWHLARRRPTKGVIVVDKARLNQLMLNLLSNAVKYTPAGGTITYVSDSEDLPDAKVRFGFEIQDTGIGMSQAFQQIMFESFSQEYDNPARPKGIPGTGLGLSIVKRDVELLGGKLEVESERGKGTTIRCHIVLPDALRDPRWQKQIQPDEPAADQKVKAVLSGRILLVEDNEINAEITKRILEVFGLAADWMENGALAVECFTKAEAGTYQAILMDIQMPIMDGYDATKAIRASSHKDAKTIPIIALTADAFQDAIDRAHQAGMDDYITKPLEPALLKQVLLKWQS